MEIKLEDKLGYSFNNKGLLGLAFIHKSFNNIENNERLEFLGDAQQHSRLRHQGGEGHLSLYSCANLWLHKRYCSRKAAPGGGMFCSA